MKQIRSRSLKLTKNHRQWGKVIEPLAKYNRNSSILGNPLDFYYEIEKKVNLASSLTGSKDNFIKTVFKDENEEIGTVVVSNNISKGQFDSEVQRESSERIQKLKIKDSQISAFLTKIEEDSNTEQYLPFIIIKQKNLDQNGSPYHNISAFTHEQYRKIITIQPNQVAQSYVYSNTKNTSLVRFFYNGVNNVAYKIDNVSNYLQKKITKSLFKIKQENESSVTFMKIMHTNKSFLTQTKNLIAYLQKNIQIKIKRCVTDWVLDPLNRYFLIDMKEIVFQYRTLSVLSKINLKQALSLSNCAVCQQKYQYKQLTKILTQKVIWQFFQHLKKRQIQLSYIPLYRYSSNFSKVCNLCYMLVVSQSKLIDHERQLAQLTHSIDPKTDQKLQLAKISSDKQQKQMYEWRLFIYFEDIRELNVDQFQMENNYYVMVKIHQNILTFKLNNPTNGYNSIKGIKIYYLFSQEPSINNFLSKTEISIRITNGNSWNAVQSQGNTYGLYDPSQKHSLRKSKQILLFNKKSKYSVAGIHLGVKLEGKLNTKGLNLIKCHDAYMADGDYSNSYSLPPEWMQAIDPSYCLSNFQGGGHFQYSLHLNKKEKKQMLPQIKKKDKKKLVL